MANILVIISSGTGMNFIFPFLLNSVFCIYYFYITTSTFFLITKDLWSRIYQCKAFLCLNAIKMRTQIQNLHL